MNSEKQVLDTQRFNSEGYAHIENFFCKDDIHIVLEEAQDIFLKQIAARNCGNCTLMGGMVELFNKHNDVFINCGKTAQHIINLHRLSMLSRVTGLLHAVGVNWPVICTRPVLFFNHPLLAKDPIYNSVPAHQDWRSMQGSSNAVVIWVPLVDCPVELGALQVLPGSHKAGLRTESMDHGFGMVALTDREEQAMVDCPAKASDVIIFHSMLIHRSGNNTTDNPRWSCHFRYNDLSDYEFINRGYVHPYTYKSSDKLL